MKSFWLMLKKDNGAASMGKCCSVFGFILWVLITIFLVLMNRSWQHYDTLTIATFSFLLVQLCNKVIDSKLFSVKQEVKQNENND